MNFLKKFFRNALRKAEVKSSFDDVSDEELEIHLNKARYDDFVLTEALRPSYDLQVVPRQGYRHDSYADEESGTSLPVLMVAVSREKLFDVFMDLIDPLGLVVDVVLETSHKSRERNTSHFNLYSEEMDVPVLKSLLLEFRENFLDDGCMGIAVLNPNTPCELQFDEHKTLVVYGEFLWPFERILRAHGIQRDDGMKLITEAEHVHSSSDRFTEDSDNIARRLGVGTWT